MSKRSYRIPMTEKWMRRLALLRSIGVSPGIRPDPDGLLALKVTLWKDQLDRIPSNWRIGRFRHDYDAWKRLSPGKYDGMEYKVVRGNWTNSNRTTSVVKVQGTYSIFDETGFEHTIYLDTFELDSVSTCLPSPLPKERGRQKRAVERAVDEVIPYEVDRWVEENPEKYAEIMGLNREAPAT